MAKVRTHQVDKKERERIIGNFFDIVANLRTRQEVVGFFISINTASEMLMIARRIQIAEMLVEGRGYEEIRKKLKVSFQTIARVYSWLYGENEVFQKRISDQIRRKQSRKNDVIKPGSLLGKYGHHRLTKKIVG